MVRNCCYRRQPSSSGYSLLRLSAIRDFRCQLPDDKLLKDRRDGIFTEPYQRGFDHLSRSLIARWVVGICNARCGEVSDHVRIIRLPTAVVALAHKRTRERVQNS